MNHLHIANPLIYLITKRQVIKLFFLQFVHYLILEDHQSQNIKNYDSFEIQIHSFVKTLSVKTAFQVRILRFTLL